MEFDEMVMVDENENLAAHLVRQRLSRQTDPDHIPVVKFRVFHTNDTYTDMAVVRFEDWEEIRPDK